MIKLKGISKRIGKKTIFNNLDFEIKEGRITSLLGLSGVGKTTLLNILSGLDLDTKQPKELEGRIGYVFQEARIIPWLTVRENLELVTSDKEKRIEALLRKFELDGLGDTLGGNLSGGEAQRVGLVRGLLVERDILLLDEVFSALDIKRKEKIMNGLIRWQEKKNKTILFITHSIEDTLNLADDVIILERKGELTEALSIKAEGKKIRQLTGIDVKLIKNKIIEKLLS